MNNVDKLTDFDNAIEILQGLKDSDLLTSEKVKELKASEIVKMETFLQDLRTGMQATSCISIQGFKNKYGVYNSIHKVLKNKNIIENNGTTGIPNWKWVTTKLPDKHMASAILKEVNHPFFWEDNDKPKTILKKKKFLIEKIIVKDSQPFQLIITGSEQEMTEIINEAFSENRVLDPCRYRFCDLNDTDLFLKLKREVDGLRKDNEIYEQFIKDVIYDKNKTFTAKELYEMADPLTELEELWLKKINPIMNEYMIFKDSFEKEFLEILNNEFMTVADSKADYREVLLNATKKFFRILKSMEVMHINGWDKCLNSRRQQKIQKIAEDSSK